MAPTVSFTWSLQSISDLAECFCSCTPSTPQLQPAKTLLMLWLYTFLHSTVSLEYAALFNIYLLLFPGSGTRSIKGTICNFVQYSYLILVESYTKRLQVLWLYGKGEHT